MNVRNKGTNKNLTKGKIAAFTAAACIIAAVSAGYQELKAEQALLPELDYLRQVMVWNTWITEERHRPGVDMTEQEYEIASQHDPEEITEALKIVRHNRALGLVPWANLDCLPLLRLLGAPVMILKYPESEGGARYVYFDKNRVGTVIAFKEYKNAYLDPRSLAELCPDLNKLAYKFHLKESKYVQGVYGLAPNYRHEFTSKEYDPCIRSIQYSGACQMLENRNKHSKKD